MSSTMKDSQDNTASKANNPAKAIPRIAQVDGLPFCILQSASHAIVLATSGRTSEARRTRIKTAAIALKVFMLNHLQDIVPKGSTSFS